MEKSFISEIYTRIILKELQPLDMIDASGSKQSLPIEQLIMWVPALTMIIYLTLNNIKNHVWPFTKTK